jgi:ankyrin repeat protein
MPMACAAFKGSPEMVKLLHELGSELTPKDKNGFIPMHLAVKFGHTAVIKYFVSKGVDVNTMTKGGTQHCTLHACSITLQL